MKAQLFSIEFFAIISGFIILIMASIMINESLAQKANNEYIESEMIKNSIDIMDLLTLTPGYPINWDSSNVLQFGLSDQELTINPLKLSRFIDLIENDYEKALSILGLEKGNLFIQISYLNSTEIFSNYPDSSQKNLFIVERACWLEGERIIMKAGVFR